MKLIKEHILPNLRTFVNNNWASLKQIAYEMQSDYSAELIETISYINELLNITFNNNNKELTTLHIHIETEHNDEDKLHISEFLSIKLFKHYQSIGNQNTVTCLTSFDILSALKRNKSALKNKCPDGASGKNGGNKIWKKWIKEQNEIDLLIDFYQKVNNETVIEFKSIFNSQKKIYDSLNKMFTHTPFCVTTDSKKHFSYNLLNSTLTLNELDNEGILIDEIDSIIMFDCDKRQLMTNFSLEEIIKWNKDYGTNFAKYIIISFGKGYTSINLTRNKIDFIRQRFKIPLNSTYTITNSEINSIHEIKTKTLPSIDFAGFESSSFWDTFILETSIRELYELRSIKLMNIYSICYCDEIKNYIIEDLFSVNESSELISTSTKIAMLELRDDDILELKEALSNTLDVIINLDIKSKIVESFPNTPTIILDEAILRNVKLLSKITNCLSLTKKINLKTWSDLINSNLNYFLILSYRDQGKYPNCYYPNLLEIELDSYRIVRSILPNFLFGHHYNWSKYHLLNEYHKLLNHPIRENHFEWNKLKNKIQTLKPEQKLDIDWNLENEYSNSEQRETFKIKLKNQRTKTFKSSDLFIMSDETNMSRKVVKIDYLISLESDDNKVYIQNLDEIQKNINIYDKIVDQKQQEKELEVIRKQFNLSDETAGRLWKVLLKNIANANGEENLYNELKSIFDSKGLKIVSQFHFKNSWINPQSESIAPLSKRVFIELCDFLKIPKIYFVIIQRIRNASKQSSRQSTRQMNQLLKDLFNDGCFDNGKNAREIINNRLAFYKLNHPLDELGIDENYLADNLVTLTELIHPELKLQELETIEKISNE